MGSALFYAPKASAQAHADIRTYLSSLGTIRVFFSNTPNQGHQISSIRLMERFRELGFGGEFEILADESTLRKFKFLIPAYDGNSEFSAPNLGRMRILPWTMPQTRAPLGITGGADTQDQWLQAMLNSDAILHLQPFNWNESQKFIVNGLSYSLDDLRQSDFSANPYLRDPIALLDSEMSNHPEMQTKVSGLREFYRHLENVELLPVYGLQRSFNTSETVLNLYKGIRASSEIEPGFWKKPILIPVFGSDFPPSITFDVWGLKSASITDPNLGERIGTMKPGEILYIEMGFVTPNIFSSIFARQTLPCVLEGKNTIALMRQMGLPFIQLRGETGDLKGGQTDIHEEALRFIEPIFSIFKKGPRWNDTLLSKTQAQDFYNFFKAARDRRSTMSQFFASLKPQGPDKVIKALQRMLDAMRGRPAATCSELFH